MRCANCDKGLLGRQTRFCGNKCKSAFYSYAYQHSRGWKRKAELIKLKGGCCCRCPYNKSFRALSFHHRVREDKSFKLDVRMLSGKTWDEILKEADKCDLICLNCHAELEGELFGSPYSLDHGIPFTNKVGRPGLEPSNLPKPLTET